MLLIIIVVLVVVVVVVVSGSSSCSGFVVGGFGVVVCSLYVWCGIRVCCAYGGWFGLVSSSGTCSVVVTVV